MSAFPKETADQKLLKMIETPLKPAGVSAKAHKIFAIKINALTLLKISNKVLIVVIVIASLVLLNEVRVGAESSRKNFYVSQSAAKGSANELIQPIPAAPDVSVYLASIKDRNIFIAFDQKPVQQTVDVSTQNRRIAEKTKFYKLVGISWLDNVDSASVMLEDTGKKTTYFLQKGEKIGDILVKTIYADSVQLGYEDEEIIIGYDKTQK